MTNDEYKELLESISGKLGLQDEFVNRLTFSPQGWEALVFVRPIELDSDGHAKMKVLRGESSLMDDSIVDFVKNGLDTVS